MNITDYIEQLENLLDEGKKVPLTNGKVIVDCIYFKGVLEDMKDNIPNEINQAKKVVKERDAIFDAAHKDAEAILKSAAEKANQLIAQEHIVVEARNKSKQIIEDLKIESNNVMTATRESANEMIAKAKQESERINEEARESADNIVVMAKRQAEETVNAAQGQARDIVFTAENQAAKLLDDAELAARRNVERSEVEAARILHDSEEQAAMLLMRANMYIDDMTTRLYKVFANAAEEVKTTHDNLKSVEELRD